MSGTEVLFLIFAAATCGGALAVVIGLGVTWLGLAVAYYSPYPIGFWVTTLAFAAYLGAGLVTRRRFRWRRSVGVPA